MPQARLAAKRRPCPSAAVPASARASAVHAAPSAPHRGRRRSAHSMSDSVRSRGMVGLPRNRRLRVGQPWFGHRVVTRRAAPSGFRVYGRPYGRSGSESGRTPSRTEPGGGPECRGLRPTWDDCRHGTRYGGLSGSGEPRRVRAGFVLGTVRAQRPGHVARGSTGARYRRRPKFRRQCACAGRTRPDCRPRHAAAPAPPRAAARTCARPSGLASEA